MATNDTENKKVLKATSFQDLYALIEERNSEKDTPVFEKGFSAYRNSTNNVVSLIAYLIGIDKEHFDNKENFSDEAFTKYEDIKETRIFRNLCRVRNSFERYFVQINTAFRNEIKNIGTVPQYIPTDAIDSLSRDGIRLYKSKPDANQYLIAVNQEINNRVNLLEKHFPEWVSWKYIKPVFLMPDGTKQEGIKLAGDYYNSDRNRYPYQCWINWNAVSIGDAPKGNILYNDEKFLTMLYERNEDVFTNLSFVRDVSNATKNNLSEFLDNSRKCIIAVDCENSNAVKLVAAISSFSKEQISKIHKILLFDSLYTTTQWDSLVERNIRKALTKGSSLPLEHVHVDRLIESKSVVDMALSVRVTTEVTTNSVDAVILVSSDSDYCAMIDQLTETKFLVMLERVKTSESNIDKLSLNNVPFCFLDDFCINASYSIKTGALIDDIQERIDNVTLGRTQEPINLLSFMNEAIQYSWITMTEKERTSFYNRYLLHMKLSVDADGTLRLKIEE